MSGSTNVEMELQVPVRFSYANHIQINSSISEDVFKGYIDAFVITQMENPIGGEYYDSN